MGNKTQSKTTKFTVQRIVLERFKQQVVDGRGTYKNWGKSEIPRRIMEGRRKVGEPKLLRMGGVVEHLRKWGNQKRQG